MAGTVAIVRVQLPAAYTRFRCFSFRVLALGRTSIFCSSICVNSELVCIHCVCLYLLVYVTSCRVPYFDLVSSELEERYESAQVFCAV